jgi:GT2 family glycosyltransferase
MISVLLATTGRPDMAEACVRSVVATTRGHDVEVVTAVDADPETLDRFLLLDWGHVRWVVDDSEDHRGCSRAWNDALAASTGDPVVLAADDLEFQPGWLQTALTRLSEFEGGWGLVGFNDGHWGAELSTHYMVSRRLITEAFGGVIAWPHYHHSFNDREANGRARQVGRYAWCEDARVYHRHWIFGDRMQDTTDTRKLDLHPESERVFAAREAAGFPNDFPSII